MRTWRYQGDVNLHYGGFFADLSTVKEGYVDVVQVTDLDSGCGFETAALIEHKTVGIPQVSTEGLHKKVEQVNGSILNLPRRRTLNYWMMVVDALLAHGGTVDPDAGWDNYRSDWKTVVQVKKKGPMTFDGWVADENLKGKSLKRYVQREHLRW